MNNNDNNNNNNNNNNATIKFTVFSLRQAIVKVHPVHLMNADLAPGNSQTKSTNLSYYHHPHS